MVCIDMIHGWSHRMKQSILKSASVWAFGVAIALISRSASADEIFEFYTGVRQLGMGGAYTGVVNDETAVLSNPAGLGKLRDVTFTVVDPELHASFNDTKIAKLEDASKVFTLQGLLDALNQSKGTHWHSKVQLFPSLVGPNFGLGVLAKYSVDAEVNEAGDVFRLDYTNDYAAALGNCLRFFGGVMKLGVTARLVNRVEVARDLDATATNLELKDVASEGLGLAADIGLILSIPVAWLPSLAVVTHDVGNTSYALSDGMMLETTTRPRDSMQKTDVGLSVFPILSNHVRAALTAEYHDVGTANEEKDHTRRVHAGMELNVHDFFFLRGGLNQRYWTAGLELASERFQLQAASYGEEIGTDTAPREDRRWVGKFTFRF